MNNQYPTFAEKKVEALEKALQQRNTAFQNFKKGLPQGNTAFALVLQNGKDELKDGISEFEIDLFLMNA